MRARDLVRVDLGAPHIALRGADKWEGTHH